MAKMQIPLNGSNFVSENRKQYFQEALEDDHQINCENEDSQLLVSAEDPVEINPNPPVTPYRAAQGGQPEFESQEKQRDDSHNLNLALNHTYNHQQRTFEIHQQYIAQQAEYIQLITAVLDQQGKALNQQDGSTASKIIETFQRTLDNFHALREQGVEIHQEFLKQQAAYLERFLEAIENGHQPVRSLSPSPSIPDNKITEWVVQQPPIVLDEQKRTLKDSSIHSGSRKSSGEDTKPTTENQGGTSLEELTGGLLEIVAEKTGYPAEMLEVDMDLEADLGIDSIKRVEILGALEERYPDLPAADTEALSQTRTLQEIIDYMGSAAGSSTASVQNEPENSPDSEKIQIQDSQSASSSAKTPVTPSTSPNLPSILLEIVAEKTGYPAEMLELEMDMEADLGIDSIKRVEILGTMEERVPGLPQVPAETLAELRTLGQIVELMEAAPGSLPAGETQPSAQKKKGKELRVENSPVKLVSVPRPDHLDFKIPTDRPILLTSEGTELTNQIWSSLTEQGWKVVLWEFPEQLRAKAQAGASKEAYRVKQAAQGLEAIRETVETLKAEHGKPAGFIHLHPLQEKDQLFSQQEEDLIKEVFFLANALQEDLIQVDPETRNLFLHITRSDGGLGLENQEDFVEGAGLNGLVKSLSWEWPEVFCRAIDFSQEMSASEIGQFVLEELHDPDRGLLEIGRSPGKRVTIKRNQGSK